MSCDNLDLVLIFLDLSFGKISEFLNLERCTKKNLECASYPAQYQVHQKDIQMLGHIAARADLKKNQLRKECDQRVEMCIGKAEQKVDKLERKKLEEIDRIKGKCAEGCSR